MTRWATVPVSSLAIAWTGSSSTDILLRRPEEVPRLELKHHKPELAICPPKLKLTKSWNNDKEDKNAYNKILIRCLF